MVKGLDSIRTQSRRPIATRPGLTPENGSKRQPTKHVAWPVILLVLIIAGGASYFYYQSLGSPSATVNTEVTKIASTEQNTTPNTGSPLTNNANTVTIYDSGAGAETTTAAITKLEAAGFATQNLSNSQLEYDKTYIWYQPEFESDAKKIATLLDDRQVVTSPIHITGSFELLIYLGKK